MTSAWMRFWQQSRAGVRAAAAADARQMNGATGASLADDAGSALDVIRARDARHRHRRARGGAAPIASAASTMATMTMMAVSLATLGLLSAPPVLTALSVSAATLVSVAAATPAAAQTRRTTAPVKPGFFTTPLTLAQMQNKQAVIKTDAGLIVIQLLPEAAPNHVGYFIKLAREGAYDGTTFHRAVRLGILQGGDPLSKTPGRREQYGTGGLGILKAERNAEKNTRGAVSAVIQPGRPDSAGAQFFIVITDQPTLDGQFDVFGRVVEGLDVAQKLSTLPTEGDGRITERVVIESVTIRDTPPPEPVPFAAETPEQLAKWRAILDTTAGAITIEFWPDKAPEHVRNFLRLARLGVYDGTPFHRVVPGFVIQTGALNGRREPLTEKQQSFVGQLEPEFNAVKHVKGIVSMARAAALNSASTSFFICVGDAASLDNQYTVFGHVTDGMPVVEQIERTPVNGEEPVSRIEIIKVRLEQLP